MLRLLELAEQSEGVRIFIGSESGLFGTSGVSMVVAPARNDGGRIVGAIGVHRSDPDQLWQDYPGRGLYCAGDWPVAG